MARISGSSLARCESRWNYFSGSGISTMVNAIQRLADKLQSGPLKRIVLTHGHADHIGSVNKLFAKAPVPVYAHRIEIPYMTGVLPYPGRKKAIQAQCAQHVQPLPEAEQGALAEVGGLIPYHTPGHSPGHVVYFHPEDKVLLSGDLFTSKSGRLHRPMPMFTANMAEALQSAVIVSLLQPAHLEVSHGNPVLKPAEHLDQYIMQTTASLKM